MKYEMNINDLFSFEGNDKGILIKSDYSNMVLDDKPANYILNFNDRKSFVEFFNDVKRTADIYLKLFHKLEKHSDEELLVLSEDFESKNNIIVSIEDPMAMKVVEIVLHVLSTYFCFLTTANKSVYSLFIAQNALDNFNNKSYKEAKFMNELRILVCVLKYQRITDFFVNPKMNDIVSNNVPCSDIGYIFKTKYLVKNKTSAFLSELLKDGKEDVFNDFDVNKISGMFNQVKIINNIFDLITSLIMKNSKMYTFDSQEENYLGFLNFKNIVKKEFFGEKRFVFFREEDPFNYSELSDEFEMIDLTNYYSIKNKTFSLLNKRTNVVEVFDFMSRKSENGVKLLTFEEYKEFLVKEKSKLNSAMEKLLQNK